MPAFGWSVYQIMFVVVSLGVATLAIKYLIYLFAVMHERRSQKIRSVIKDTAGLSAEDLETMIRRIAQEEIRAIAQQPTTETKANLTPEPISSKDSWSLFFAACILLVLISGMVAILLQGGFR